MAKDRRKCGMEAERIACRFLEAHGMVCLERNVSTRWGEIDLVMRDGQAIVFVEVRYRASNDFGHPAETVTRAKQVKIRKSVTALLNAGKYLDQALRFDVVAISNQSGKRCIDWCRNAFE